MIFVSIAAFCDPFLSHTIQDAISKASRPERLVFGVVDQTPQSRRAELSALCAPAQLRYVQMDPVESRGVCWARSIACSLYQGENFFFQIDSHMLFEPAWDEQLLQLWQDLKKFTHKPIISTYPYGFEFEEGKAVVKISVSDKTTLVLRPKPESSLSQANATLSFRAEHVFVRQPVLGSHVAGGFLFTHGDFIDEIPYDPRLYFHGEEQSIALRAFTHGWDIYHPSHIPVFHLYKMPHTSHENHHWHPKWDMQRDIKFTSLTELAAERLKDLVYQRRDLGSFGLGQERSVEDFAKRSGINYLAKKIIIQYQEGEYAFA
jgi:Glycosyltransferase (GlcNAc)